MIPRPRQAVILAGGMGKRMRPLTATCPKHMLAVHGRPFLEYVLEMLREQGFERVLLLLGYLPDLTSNYVGDRAECLVTPADWETGLRLRHALPRLEERFLLMYCDNYWPMRFLRMWQSYLEAGEPLAQMTVYSNSDGYSRSNLAVDETGFVTRYDHTRESAGLNGVDIGYLILRRQALAGLTEENAPFEKQLYPLWAAERQLAAFTTPHRYYSVGSPDRLPLTETFFARAKTIIVDRDGVLNRRPAPGDYVRSWREWQWLDGAREGLRALKEAGYRVLVASNQAGIARGMVLQQNLAIIDRRMKHEAEAAGGRIEAAYYCPHGWDQGCDCRKPKAGMLYEAQRDYHLDLTRTWFVGDDPRDAEAAEAAGCRYAEVSEGRSLAQVAAAILEQTEREAYREWLSVY